MAQIPISAGYAELTSLSAPSMQKYFTLRSGFAFFKISDRRFPVNRAVERLVEPHENIFVFLATFCAFRRFRHIRLLSVT